MYHALENNFSGFKNEYCNYVEYSRGLIFHSFKTKQERHSFVEEKNKHSKFLYGFPVCSISSVVYHNLIKRKEKDLQNIEFCNYRKWLKDNTKDCF